MGRETVLVTFLPILLFFLKLPCPSSGAQQFCNMTIFTNMQRNGSCANADILLSEGFKLATLVLPPPGQPCVFEKIFVANTIQCCPGYTGTDCTIQVNDAFQYCYESSVCEGPKVFWSNEQRISLGDCCGQRSNGSWGGDIETCIACNFQNFKTLNRTLQIDPSCRLTGTQFMKTFDGNFFPLQSDVCTYNLLEYGKEWIITLTILNCQSKLSCRKSLTIKFEEKILIAEGFTVSLNGYAMDFLKGEVKDDVFVYKHNEYMAIEISTIPIKILMDEKLFIQITPNEILLGDLKLKGLCGDYDKNPSNDFKRPDGVYLKDFEEFVEAYITPPYKCLTNKFSSEMDSRFPEANSICLLASLFDKCPLLITNPMLKYHCYNSVRAAGTKEESYQAACTAMAEISFECLSFGSPVPNWRLNTPCRQECLFGMVYSDCAPPCPKTCASVLGKEISACNFFCTPGCHCPENKIYENGKCIDLQDCPCEYEGKKFPAKSQVKMECNLCMCYKGKWTCEERKCPSTCTILGRNTIVTFDKLTYTLEPVACAYTLVQTKARNNILKVSLEFTSCMKPFLSIFNCSVSLRIDIQDITAKITQHGLYINGDYNPKLNYMGKIISIMKASSLFYVIDGPDFNIMYNPGEEIYMKFQSSFRKKVQGLCGNFDSNINNEFVGLNGLSLHKTKFTQEFLASSCFADQREDIEIEPCSVYVDNLVTAKQYCSYLQESPVFLQCRDTVAIKPYYDLCMRDICASEVFSSKGFCTAMQSYTKECADNKIIVDWRSNRTLNNLCVVKCPSGSGQKYTYCGSSCQSSCNDLSKEGMQCEEGCIFGCRCPNGTLLDNRRNCVAIDKCTCFNKFEQKHYKAGEVIHRRQLDCTCIRGKWKCVPTLEEVICPRNQIWITNATGCQETCSTLSKPEECMVFENEFEGCRCPKYLVLSPNGTCVPPEDCPCQYGDTWMIARSKLKIGCSDLTCTNGVWKDERKTDSCPATCWASGEPHHSTFDGIHYSFHGNCEYVMSESTDGTFSITTKNVKCGYPAVTCTKDIIVHIFGNTINFVQGNTPTINGQEISDRGFTSAGTRVYIHLTEKWMGKVQGLCGNFDQDSTNDFISRSNSFEHVASAFAHSWRLYDCPLIPQDKPEYTMHPCDFFPSRRHWAMESCAPIKYGGTFALCRNNLPDNVVEMYYDDCIYDACGRCSGSGIVVKWRNNNRCAVMCEEPKVYRECGPANPRTCKDLWIAHEENSTYCTEGCHCPLGQVEDGGKCIPEESCPCLYEGKLYPSGTKIFVASCKNCTCKSGNMTCDTCKCHEDEFQCEDGHCINKTKICDGNMDCFSGSDEHDCVIPSYSTVVSTLEVSTNVQKPATRLVFTISTITQRPTYATGLCDQLEAMNDESFIPDTAISLQPSVGNPGDIRPDFGWRTNTNDTRIITLDIGPNLDVGGSIRLVRHENVKSYTVFISHPSAKRQIQESTPDRPVAIPQHNGQTTVQIELSPIDPTQDMLVSLSAKLCKHPISTTTAPVTSATASTLPTTRPRLCDLSESMNDESFMPDTAISLNPPVGNPGDIRPDVGWITNSKRERFITLDIGPNLDAGAIIRLIQHVNVKTYTILLSSPIANNTFKTSSPDKMVNIPQGNGQTTVTIVLRPLKPNEDMLVTVSAKLCKQPISTVMPTVTSPLPSSVQRTSPRILNSHINKYLFVAHFSLYITSNVYLVCIKNIEYKSYKLMSFVLYFLHPMRIL
ncbi:SCO-spondin-like [Octopus bimaculoides]|uniref:SCO-spondin-like n=1 Tax=Octopus bimaculoides TaxID=37653 RepID=UPI0022E5182B|nr:SCO-spondin-like [Octopus bimaculoides]